MMHDLPQVGRHFDMRGRFLSAAPYGSGHINDTYAAWYSQGGTRVRYIHQRINYLIFQDPPALMQNVERVTSHIRAKLATADPIDVTRRVLTLIRAEDGRSFYVDPEGNTWRTYIFIKHAQTYDEIMTHDQAKEAARAFGVFQNQLRDLPGPRLHDTIPGFHDTPGRFNALQDAIAADRCNRAAGIKDELNFALQREDIVGRLLDLNARGEIPEIITHSDTKLNNVMLDDETGEGICVIDLDTVMPGLALYDFGDMARSAMRPCPEDEQDLSKVVARPDMFAALAEGYLSSTGDQLNACERHHLAFSTRLITFEIGIRFLTDYLQGDVYFKTHREGHNLDRCRVQFKMVESIEEQTDELERMVGQLG
jgi:hypothetical protein